MPLVPATVATSTWDIVGWNRAALRALTDYEALPPDQRNILRRMFLDPATRQAQGDWEAVARFLVATLRAEAARTGEDRQAADLAAELSAASAEFKRLWGENDIRTMGEGAKLIRHAAVGELAFEFSSFCVDGRPDLRLIVYTPARPCDAEKMRVLMAT